MWFEGKVVVVTGGASGMGEATAWRMAREGASVVIGDIDVESGEQVAKDIVASGGTAIFCPTDVSDEAAVHALIGVAVSEFGRLDLAANIAGVPQAQVSLLDTDHDLLERTYGVNLRGLLYCLQAEIPEMLKVGGGAIVNITSLAGIHAFDGLTAYVTSKHGATGLTKNAASEFLSHNIRINGICPGATATKMFLEQDPQVLAAYAAAQPMKRLGRPEELANVVAFLLSDEASFIAGVMLPVDGGWTNQGS